MKLCFIAKDVGEFVRYLKWINQFAEGLKHLPRETVSRILLEPLGEKAQEQNIYNAELNWASLLATDVSIRELRVHVMLNACKDDEEYSKKLVCDHLTSRDKKMVDKRKVFLKNIERCMLKNGNDAFDADTFVFIHWGGGDPVWCEEQFQPFCDEHPEITKGLRAFALSSRRRELFNVSAPQICLPKTKADAQLLIDRFSFARINDLMSEYVVHYFAIAKGEQSSSPVPFVTDDKRLSPPLHEFLVSLAQQLESHPRYSDIDKRRLQTVKKLLETVKWNEGQLQLPHDAEIAELFSSLIRGGGHV